MILVYASYKQGFDKKIPDHERTYRIITRLTEGKYWSRSFACYPDVLSGRPEIENMTSFIHTNNNRIRVGESDYTVPESVIADTAFLDFFNVECMAGWEGVPQPAEHGLPGCRTRGKTFPRRECLRTEDPVEAV